MFVTSTPSTHLLRDLRRESRHDPDAIHCKHCGEPLKIEPEGSD